MKKVIIVGATSGIGKETALLYIKKGWKVGIAGRRKELLDEIQQFAPERVVTEVIDVMHEDAGDKLNNLIHKNGGMDVFLLSSGIGSQNPELLTQIEVDIARTNVEGFMRMVGTAFHYFEQCEKGHIAVISSIAGTKGLGIAPGYSATKRFQNCYIDALEQLARMKKKSIVFTDIRPGFVATPILKKRNYPMLMQADKVAMHLVNGIEKKKRICIIDWRYRLLVFIWRLIPRSIWKRLPVKNG